MHGSCMYGCICPLADGTLNVAYPNVLVLLGGSMELIHLRRGGITDEKHASLLIGYIPHYQVLKRQHWRLVLDHTADKCLKKVIQRKRKSETTKWTVVFPIICTSNATSVDSILLWFVCVFVPFFLPDMERCTSGLSPAETLGCLSSARPVYLDAHMCTHTHTV